MHLLFVEDQIKISLNTDEKEEVEMYKNAYNKELGKRSVPFDSSEIYINKKDFDEHIGKEVRLKDLMNIEIEKGKSKKSEGGKSKDINSINWVSTDSRPATILTARGETLEGRVERTAQTLDENTIVYFEKLGFARLENKEKMEFILSY